MKTRGRGEEKQASAAGLPNGTSGGLKYIQAIQFKPTFRFDVWMKYISTRESTDIQLPTPAVIQEGLIQLIIDGNFMS